MLSLSRIFLHNWHRFKHNLIEVEDSLYLAGNNGSGKSSVLDAIQMVLIADQGRIQFNKSAQDHSERNLDSYVRGKIGEDRWLRPGNTVACIALEFTDKRAKTATTVGVCIEAASGKTPDRTFFILPECLDVRLFAPDGKSLTRRELKAALHNRRGAKVYDPQVHEYQDDLLNRLGGLNRNFFDLFLRALHFKPISKISDFVEQWLLEKKDIHLDTLQTVCARLHDLRDEAERVERRIAALNGLIAQQGAVQQLLNLREQWTLLTTLLRAEAAQRQAVALLRDKTAKQAELDRAHAELAHTQAALAGAEAARKDAERRLIESAAAQYRDELRRHIERLAQEAKAIRARWAALQGDLRREVDHLRGVHSESAGLQVGEADALGVWLAAVDALDAPSSSEAMKAMTTALDALLPLIAEAARRATAAHAVLSEQVTALGERGRELEREITDLQAQGNIRFDPDVERMQDRLRGIIGDKPRLLCELLEITDPRWQNAVEAMLGRRRFNLIVPPPHFRAAMRELNRARAEDNLFEVGLIDLAAALQDARPARPRSLAGYVHVDMPEVRAYVDAVLGDIIACERIDDLNQHRRAVTPDVVIYGEYVVRAANPKSYLPNFIGRRARQSQIEARQRELSEIAGSLARLVPEVQHAEALGQRLNRHSKLAVLRDRLDAPLDETPLLAQLAKAQAELRALDLSDVDELEREVTRLEAVVRREREAEGNLRTQIGSFNNALATLDDQHQAAERGLVERAVDADQALARWPEAIAGAEELLSARPSSADPNDEVRRAEIKAKEFDTKAANETEALIELATRYNTDWQFSANARDPREPRYAEECDRLAATDLPNYRERIEHAQREAEQELREHVLHTLREQIEDAKRKINQINDALGHLEFGTEKYRFRYDRAEDLQEFYELITVDSQVLGRGSLFESQFYQEHKPAFDRFYEELTRKPQSEADRLEQERLTDYRRYLNYDIVVINRNTGQESRLSRIMNQTSGGETQTPFYLTIAASFVQLYRIQERSGRPTIRVVAFDEAFNKMDQDRIGATLDLFQKFNLQVITATPLERCEYLVPKMCTSLVLTGVKDTVHIEPYRNYTARLHDRRGASADADAT